MTNVLTKKYIGLHSFCSGMKSVGRIVNFLNVFQWFKSRFGIEMRKIEIGGKYLKHKIMM